MKFFDVPRTLRMKDYGRLYRPENFLYLSFWRYLIRRQYYGNLWLPTLHQAFPGLKNGKGLTTFKELDLRFGKALIVRMLVILNLSNIATYLGKKTAPAIWLTPWIVLGLVAKDYHDQISNC